jgi:hypothetical protein
MSKTCFKCGKLKDLSEFYVHHRMTDGHLGKCKECAKLDSRKNRLEHLEYYLEYDRKRSKLPHRIALMRRVGEQYENDHPLRVIANTFLRNAVRDGRCKKGTKCHDCGKHVKLCGHHEDYYKPLDVVWLCYSCHKKRHNKKPKLKE